MDFKSFICEGCGREFFIENMSSIFRDSELFLCQNCDSVERINDYIEKLRAELARKDEEIEVLDKLVEASREIMEARDAEIRAALAHDDYNTGGKIHTNERLETAKKQVLNACERGAAARARLAEVRGER